MTYSLAVFATASIYESGAALSFLLKIEPLSITGIAGIYLLAWLRPGWLARFMPPDERDNDLPSQRVLNGLFSIFPVLLFSASFSAFKTMIPEINPFGWDAAFAVWDANLHGGMDPWRLLHPVLGYPVVTFLVDWIYVLWFFVVFGALFWQAFSITNAERRMRFLLSFVLSWIVIGTVAATLLSSAGPVYLAQLSGDEFRYADLLAYLQEVDRQYAVLMVKTQELLWSSYQLGETNLGRGISAMPSMHVATSVMVALLFWRSGPVARTILILFVVMILLGSVHLAWHYAIDGYVAVAMAIAIWKAAAPLARRSLAHK